MAGCKRKMNSTATSQLWRASARCLPYGLLVRCECLFVCCGKGVPHNYGRYLLVACFMGHRERYIDVDRFWKNIEMHEELRDIENDASRSLMNGATRVLETTMGNVHSSIEKINVNIVGITELQEDKPKWQLFILFVSLCRRTRENT
ncbi:hypothetical protein Glove_529g26 [Diversispora epigaea]|uniref:Uncharacterized protein n=1 Tax=Diversispora epigaea TaxID=1348612 RepID=A0A397GDP1_9GLOM|nr:hypothetical protein Glove_529g26 [Diversispora epigaea]